MLRALGLALTAHRPRCSGYAWFDYERPLVIAHRGGGGLRPENTLAAFEHADALGVDAFETDVQLTADGELVVSHDPYLERVSDGVGEIASMTLEEVLRVDMGYHFTPDDGATYPWRGQGLRMPTLRELFARFPNQRYVIDCKPANTEAALKLATLSEEMGMADRVCLASFHFDNLLAIRRRYPHIATSASPPEVQVFWAAQWLRIDALYRNQALALQVPPKEYGVPFLTSRFVQRTHAHNMHVHVWTIDEPEEMRRLLDLGVNGIVTDYPDRLIEVMKEFGRP
ncbi:MAG: hypothetical protein RLZZ303_2152 [Candidatus Hydrogenedentota bacterium]|jgi:glycerophosphoryl diester phosphodiesterase